MTRVQDTLNAERKAMLLEAVLPAIEAALAGGWDPESRGRAYRHEVPETGPSEG